MEKSLITNVFHMTQKMVIVVGVDNERPKHKSKTSNQRTYRTRKMEQTGSSIYVYGTTLKVQGLYSQIWLSRLLDVGSAIQIIQLIGHSHQRDFSEDYTHQTPDYVPSVEK